MERDYLKNEILKLTKKAILSGLDYPREEGKHATLAKKYKDGIKAYYDKQIYELLSNPQSGLGMAWVNSGCPDMEGHADWITAYYPKMLKYIKPDELLNFVEEDLNDFFRMYYQYKFLKSESISANTKAKYDIPLSVVAKIYDLCCPAVIDCHPLVFCNAVYNPDTFCNIHGVKSTLMLFVNLVLKIRGLGTLWRKEVCNSMNWDEKECSKRSVQNDMSAQWCNELKKLSIAHQSRR